jgi:hypothetical protein
VDPLTPHPLSRLSRRRLCVRRRRRKTRHGDDTGCSFFFTLVLVLVVVSLRLAVKKGRRDQSIINPKSKDMPRWRDILGPQ